MQIVVSKNRDWKMFEKILVVLFLPFGREREKEDKENESNTKVEVRKVQKKTDR